MDSASKQMADQIIFQKVDGGGNAKDQIKAINDAIAKKPQVLMISPVDNTVLPSIAKAKSAGIFVFQLDRCYVSWTRKDDPANSFYGADLKGAGAVGPFQYAIIMKKKGTGLIIPDNSTEAGREILQGMKYSIAKKFTKQITVVMGDDCGSNEQKAKQFVASYLKSGKPLDVIFTTNDQATLGAAAALKEAGASKYIFGVGGSTKAVFDAVKDGSVYAVTVVPPGGPSALEEVPVALKHQRTPKDSFTPLDMIIQKNVDHFLQTPAAPAS